MTEIDATRKGWYVFATQTTDIGAAMNKTQLQTTVAPLVGVAAGYLAGAHVLDLSAGDWSIVLTGLLGVGAVLWPALVTRAKSLKDTVGGLANTAVVTDAASAAALPNNIDVVAVTPAIVAAINAAKAVQ